MLRLGLRLGLRLFLRLEVGLYYLTLETDFLPPKLVRSLVLSNTWYSVRVRVQVGFATSFKVEIVIIFTLRQISYH